MQGIALLNQADIINHTQTQLSPQREINSPDLASKLPDAPPNAMNSANDHHYIDNIKALESRGAMVPRIDNLVVAVSSGALFDFSTDHLIAKTEGSDAYTAYQVTNEDSVLEKGEAFSLVDKLFSINQKLADINSPARFDVVITSKNTPDACVRAIRSADHYKLPIFRTAFTNGASPFKYAKAFDTSLYLTTNPDDAKLAVAQGVPAAHILPSKKPEQATDQLRIAFDADAVIFSDESERVSQTKGLTGFYGHELANAAVPLNRGPLYPFLHQLSRLKKEFPKNEAPIRIAVTTARAAPAAERLIKTLRSWDIELDELHLLGGKDKGPFLEAFGADIFFDDKLQNVEAGAKYVTSGHVLYGINNEENN